MCPHLKNLVLIQIHNDRHGNFFFQKNFLSIIRFYVGYGFLGSTHKCVNFYLTLFCCLCVSLSGLPLPPPIYIFPTYKMSIFRTHFWQDRKKDRKNYKFFGDLKIRTEDKKMQLFTIVVSIVASAQVDRVPDGRAVPPLDR